MTDVFSINRMKPAVVFIAVCAAMVASWVGYFIVVRCSFGPLEHAGVFGDMFGGFTALLTAVGFAGIATTLYLQMRELEETRKDLEESRKSRLEADRRTEKQIEIFQLQLKQMAERNERERLAYLNSIEPLFNWERLESHQLFSIRNVGGRISDLNVRADTKLKWRQTFDYDTGYAVIALPLLDPKTQCFVELRYMRNADRAYATQRFTIAEGIAVPVDSEI